MCGGMDESDNDQIAKGFAELTMFLEDAVALAADGQSGDQSRESTRALSGSLRLLLNASVTKLDRIDHRIDDFNTG